MWSTYIAHSFHVHQYTRTNALAGTMKSIVIQGIITLLFCGPNHALDTSEKSNHDELFPLSIIHMNDFHARFEETNEGGTSCKSGEKCIGGYARAVTVVKELQRVRANPLYLNAGDNFQGTLWYSIGGWNVTSQFLNMLNADAVTLGNHEFDRGIDGVVPFIEHLISPVIVANIDDSDEPTLQGKYKKSIIIDRYDRKIGIIGVILSTTNEIANTEKLNFNNESVVIRREAELLKAQGVNIIIVLSHCGLDIDYRITKETAPLVDVIVGGHSHTFMYTVEEGETAPGPDIAIDNYPAVVESENGHKTLIVQASAFMKYVGDLIVYFDKHGRVVKWQGAPIYLDTNIEQDPHVIAAIQPWKKIIDAKGLRTVGKTKVSLQQHSCGNSECNLGNFVADAFVHHFITNVIGKESLWEDSIIALVNSGGVRNTLSAGAITFGDLSTTIPFENTVDMLDIRGDHLKDVFEHAVEGEWKSNRLDNSNLVQISGAKVVYNMTRNSLNRVESIELITFKDGVPRYEPFDPNRYYRCITSSYLADGGDAIHMIPKYRRNLKRGLIDIDVVMKYLEHRKIIYTGRSDRIE